MTTIFVQVKCEDGRHSCVVEDNGRVAYAYLLQERKVVGDLWLYNQAATPDDPEWKTPSPMPFLNAMAYVNFDSMQKPLVSQDEIRVDWELGDNADAIEVRLFLRRTLYGILKPNAKPGWTIAALKDGPLARVMSPTAKKYQS